MEEALLILCRLTDASTMDNEDNKHGDKTGYL